jgi:hypothetical protein
MIPFMRHAKAVLLVISALGYGFLPAVAELTNVTLLTLFIPILLGLIYFVLHQQDWPPQLVPCLFGCLASGRVAGYLWLNLRHGRIGPVVDTEVWVFGTLAAVGFAFALWRWMRAPTEMPKDENPSLN